MKKREKEGGRKINFSNRLSYTLIAVFILAAVGIGVYALSPGVAPNPGHLISDVAPPLNCSANQVLQWAGSNWACVALPSQNLSNINSSFVVTLGTKNWDQISQGTSWFYVGQGFSNSLNFYVYKPVSASFTASGTPATATLSMLINGDTNSYGYPIKILTVNQVDFQQKNGGYNAANAAGVMLLPGQYHLSVSGTSPSAWLQLNSVYGQDNNHVSTVWVQD